MMKHFKLFFACMLMLVFGFGQVWATEETAEFTYSDLSGQGTSGTGSAFTGATDGDITMGGTGYGANAHVKIYANGTLTFTPLNGVTIKTIELTAVSADKAKTWSSSPTGVSVSGSTISWSGASTTVVTLTNTASAQAQITGMVVSYETSGGSTKCSTPSISPAACSFYGSQQVTITTATADAAIYYTTDNTAPSKTNGTLYTTAFAVSDATTTVKAIAVKDGLDDSDVASVTYTYAGPAVTSYDIDFETNALGAYVNWDFNNIGIRSTISAHGGTYYGSNVNSNGNGVTTASITTKAKYAAPGTLTFYISKESTNNTASYWKAQVSSNGTDWTDVQQFDAHSNAMNSGAKWNECTADLSAHTNVYVRISYGSSGAIRAIDDISLEAASSVAKPTISVTEDYFLTSTTVTLGCTTDGATVYYTLDGTDPKTSGSKLTYSAPFDVTTTATIRVIANKGSDWSAEATSKNVEKLEPISTSDALTIIAGLDNKTATTRNYLVQGTICESPAPSITAGGTGTYYISADGSTTNQLQVYKGLYKDGANFTATDQIQAGDDVTIVGKLKKYNTNNELDENNAIVTHKPKARLSWSAASYTASMSGSNSFPTLTNTNGVTVTYSSSNTAVADFTDQSDYSTLTLKTAGTDVTITATFAGNGEYKANTATYTLNVEAAVERGTITFNVDGGDAIAPIADATELPNPLPIPTKAGKNFVAWYTNSGKTDEAVAGAAVTEDITLYAVWREPYTVTEALAIIATYGNNAGGAYDVYVAGKVSTASSSNPSSGKLTYSISVDGTASDELKIYLGKGVNDANFTDKTDVQVNDQVVVLGKLYKYYNTSTFVTTPEVNTPNHLYSLIRKAEAELSWSASSAVVGITGDKNYPSIVNPHSLTGIKYSSSDPTVASFADENTYAITLNAAGTTTITATFEGNEDYKEGSASYTLEVRETLVYGNIDFDCDGANSCPDGIVHATNLPSPLPTVTKDGFNFGGWFTNADKTDAATAGAPLTGDVTLYAKWIEIPTFNNSGYEWQLVTDDAQLVAGKYYVIASDTKGKVASAISSDVLGTETAVFADGAIAYNAFGDSKTADASDAIVFELGGTSSAWTLSEVVDDSGLLGYKADKKVKWGGDATTWTISIADNNATIVPIEANTYHILYNVNSPRFTVYSSDPTASMLLPQLYVWALKTYKLRYDANGGEDAPAAQAADGEGKATVTSGIPTAPTDKVFDKWNTQYDGNGTDKAAGDVIDLSTADVTLYAIWRDPYNNITVNYDANGGEGSIDADVNQVEGTQYTIKANTFTREGYTFAGWKAYDALDNELTITSNKITIPSTNVTIKAQWGELTVTDFVLVTNVNQLQNGDKVYIVAAGDRNFAAGELSGSILSKLDIQKTVDKEYLVLPDGATEPVEYTVGISGDQLTLQNGTQYLYSTTVKNMGLRNDAFNWTVSVSEDGVATLNCSVGDLKYNASSPRFTTYASGQQDISLYKKANYTRAMTEGRYGTICLPNGGVLLGADMYEVAYYGETSKKIFFDEILSGVMEAGVPYVFLPQEGVNKLAVVYTDDADAAATNRNGLVGFIGTDADDEIPVLEGMYILQNNQYREVLAGADARIKSYRAYINLGAITPTAPALAPGRRRISMGVASENSATGMDELNASETPVKMMIDGQLYILRGEKLYDATGRLVK